MEILETRNFGNFRKRRISWEGIIHAILRVWDRNDSWRAWKWLRKRFREAILRVWGERNYLVYSSHRDWVRAIERMLATAIGELKKIEACGNYWEVKKIKKRLPLRKGHTIENWKEFLRIWSPLREKLTIAIWGFKDRGFISQRKESTNSKILTRKVESWEVRWSIEKEMWILERLKTRHCKKKKQASSF